MPLEQSPGECLYTLATTAGLSPEAVAVAVDFNTAATALEDWREDRGALLLLKPDEEPNDSDSNGPSDVNGPSSLDKFLDAVAVSALGLSRGNVRLLVVDPLNNRMPGVVGAGQQAMRQALLGAIRRIKQSGTNVLLVVEEQSGQLGHFGSEGPASDIAFAENVADIIVRLSTRNRHNYSTRYLEVKKSRTQREQRGEHAFSIKSGEGVVIVPSVASVHARSQSRSPAVPTKSVEFGLSCVDEMLGHGTLFRGDLLVLQGPRGCYKTQIALPFLLGGDVRERGRGEAPLVSLLFAARDSVPAVRDQLARLGLDDAAGRDVELRIVPLPRGHVQPGRLLQLVENEFERLAIDGKSLHRLAIDNVNLWESSSPEVAEDATFAVTLVELLRGYRRTCLLVCDDALQTGANGLQDSLAGLCDTLLRFERYEFRGAWRVGVRVLKSRGMSHRLENFEVVLEDGRVVARPSTSLLRVTAGRGTVEPVPIRLFFRVESEVHRKYYEAFRDALKLSVSPTTSLESQDRAALVRQMGMGDVSVIDELQIMEIDEFQLRSAEPSRKPDSSLAGFSLPEHWVEQRWAEHLPRFSKKCEIHSHDPSEVRRRAFAVPFYANIGLMAYDRRGIVDPASLCSWEKIAKLAWEWEQAHRLDDGVFFEYPRGSAENYNCLFWEILLSQIDMKSLADGWCPLRGWLNSKAGIRAAALLRLLCRRAYKVGGGEEDSMRWMAGRTYSDGEANDKRVYDVSANAIVYRHWYSTLNEMMRALSSSADGRRKLEELTICELPGGIAISGEWYLGISAHSAAPRAGLSLIEALTTRDAELNRVRLGVGLPTRYQYYACGESERQLAISPYFSMEARRVRVLVEGAFSRSSFQCYEEIGPIVAHHVCRLIQQSGPEELSFAEAEHNASVLATTALAGLVEELDYLQSGMYATRGRGEKFRCPLSKHCFHNVMFGVSDVTATQRRGGTCSAGCINRSRQQTEQEPVTPL
jgi:KaiC/GvpD/RAD55 family RecA-like ATPase